MTYAVAKKPTIRFYPCIEQTGRKLTHRMSGKVEWNDRHVSDTNVRHAIDFEMRIDDTTLLPREHRKRSNGVWGKSAPKRGALSGSPTPCRAQAILDPCLNLLVGLKDDGFIKRKRTIFKEDKVAVDFFKRELGGRVIVIENTLLIEM